MGRRVEVSRVLPGEVVESQERLKPLSTRIGKDLELTRA